MLSQIEKYKLKGWKYNIRVYSADGRGGFSAFVRGMVKASFCQPDQEIKLF